MLSAEQGRGIAIDSCVEVSWEANICILYKIIDWIGGINQLLGVEGGRRGEVHPLGRVTPILLIRMIKAL